MKNAFQWFLISTFALACIAAGQPTRAETRVVATAGAPTKLHSNAKLTIVRGDNQTFTGPKPPGTPCPYTSNANCNWPPVKPTFSALAVKLTDLGGLPIPNAPIVFTCHLPAGAWACQFTPSGPLNGTISITTGRSGVATLDRMAGNGVNIWCNYILNAPPCEGDALGYPGQVVTVTAAYGNIASTTFNLRIVLFY